MKQPNNNNRAKGVPERTEDKHSMGNPPKVLPKISKTHNSSRVRVLQDGSRVRDPIPVCALEEHEEKGVQLPLPSAFFGTFLATLPKSKKSFGLGVVFPSLLCGIFFGVSLY